MNKYLLEILQEANTIIIPGLGALTVTNKDKGEMMFMSYLKHDDGALSSYIAQKDGVDETEAKNIIARYVREIQSKLDQGESFDVFGLGSFVKDKDGDVEFVGNEPKSDGDTSVAVKEEAIIEQTIVESISHVEADETKTPVTEKADEEVVIPAEEPDEETITEPIQEETVEREVEAELPADEIVIPPVEPVAEATSEFIEQPFVEQKELTIAEKEELSKNVDKLEKLNEKAPQVIAPSPAKEPQQSMRKSTKKDAKKSVSATKEKKKRGAGFWILIVLLLLLGGGGTYFGINYNELKQHIPFLADKAPSPEKKTDAKEKMEELMGETTTDVESEEETAVQEVETPKTTSEPVTAPTKEVVQPSTSPKKVTASSSSTSGGPYKIICGVFAERANADRMLANLKAEGLPAEILPSPSGMNFVCMKAFDTEAEASQALGSLRNLAPKAWLMKMP